MSHPQYGQWNPEDVKSEGLQGQEQYSTAAHAAGHRRAEDQQMQFGDLGYAQQAASYRRSTGRPSSSSPTSSLSGAMGETHISHQHAPAASPSGMAWTPSHSMPQPGYVPEDTDMTYLGTPPTPLTSASPSGAFSMYSQYNVHSYPTHDTISQSGIPSPGYQDFSYSTRAQQPLMHPTGMSPPLALGQSSTSASIPISRSSRSLEEEVQRLHYRIRELEAHHDAARRRVKELENELARSAGPSGSLPTPLPTPTLPAMSPAFQADWKARTDARVKIWCAPNRAGNALCAWHEPRRERRMFPPRMAPAGFLNCGCTYEQALFEESLARHAVGSYRPGESVRMDPTLRNPLLELLKHRYGYRDGDFERDLRTGGWTEGEDAAHWEAKLAAGPANIRKNHAEERR